MDMANWGNVRLVVLGSRAEVSNFAKRSQRSRKYFTAEMRYGEVGRLQRGPLRRSPVRGMWEQTYYFQTAHDDDRAHFTELSKRHPGCWFAAGFSDPNADATGGYLIRDGACRTFDLSSRVKLKFRAQAGYRDDVDSDDNEFFFWEAEWRMLDACVEHARQEIASWGRSRWKRAIIWMPAPTVTRKKPRRSRACTSA